MKYILLIDHDPDILNIQVIALSTFYGGDVILAKDGVEGLEKLKVYGEPELIVADQNILLETGETLYSHLSEKNLLIPLVLCSTSFDYENRQKEFPLVSAFVQKPFSIESLRYLVKSITNETITQPSFIAVKIPILLNFVGQSFDLYLKLSEINFVKVVKQGQPFTKEDSERLIRKGVNQLYISIMDSQDFLLAYEENLNLLLTSKKVPQNDKELLTIESLISIETVAKQMGWTEDVVESAKRSISTALRIIGSDSHLIEVLKSKLANPSSEYSLHIGLLSYFCCVLSDCMGRGGESTQTKLALAALFHDLAVEDRYYENINDWNDRAENPKDRSADTVKYRLHPLEASKLIQNLKNVPPDVDQILLQHHENKDGSGFPRSLTSSRISPLSTFFIIMEDLVNFIGDGKHLEVSIADFITWGDMYYDSGNFSKIYLLVRARLQKN